MLSVPKEFIDDETLHILVDLEEKLMSQEEIIDHL